MRSSEPIVWQGVGRRLFRMLTDVALEQVESAKTVKNEKSQRTGFEMPGNWAIAAVA